MNLRLYIYILLSLLALSGAEAQTNKKIRSLQREQTSLKKDIAGQESLLRSTRKDVNAQLANLQVISAQIEGQEKVVRGIHSEIDTLTGEIGGLEHQLKKLEAELTSCKQKYSRAINYMFHNRLQLSKWQFILSAKNYREMYRRMRYMTQFSKYQQKQGEYIQKVEAEVKEKRAALLGKKQEKGRLLAEGKGSTATSSRHTRGTKRRCSTTQSKTKATPGLNRPTKKEIQQSQRPNRPSHPRRNRRSRTATQGGGGTSTQSRTGTTGTDKTGTRKSSSGKGKTRKG